MFRRPEHGAGNRPFVDAGLRSGNNAPEAPRHSSARGVFPSVDLSAQERRRSIAEQMRAKLRPEFGQVALAKPVEVAVTPEAIETPEFVFGNSELPSWQKKNEIIHTIEDNQVTVIVGPTGSGKSTQVPQFLLEAGFEKVVLTQPRLMAANGVADRIRDELQKAFNGEEEARELVGVQTSEKYEKSDRTRIFVRTDGLEQVIQLEERLGRMARDRATEEAAQTVLILDEVHESNPNLVGLLAVMKRVITRYPSMRLVVMSATVNAERYSDYFADASIKGEVPVVEIEGRTHEVAIEEHPELTVEKALDKILHIAKDLHEGDDILVFAPGKEEIKDVIEACQERLKNFTGGVLNFLPLHAKMSEAEQAKVLPDHKGINIIVATDVAMTSLTFPRVKYVFDQGLTKNPQLDEEGTSGLVLETCSKAECLQRAGRAGRVQPGTYMLLNPGQHMPFVSLDARQEYPTPPIFSTDLSRMSLLYAAHGIDLRELDLIDNVSFSSRQAAFDKLRVLGAVDEDDAITETGRLMNKFSLGTEYARMMAEALKPGVPGTVTRNVALIAAAFEVGGLGMVARWNSEENRPTNDAMLQMQLFHKIGVEGFDLQRDQKLFREHGLDAKNVMKARKAFRKIIRAMGQQPHEIIVEPPNEDEWEMIHHCVAAGFVDAVYTRTSKKKRVSPHKQTSKERSNFRDEKDEIVHFYEPLARDGLRRTISDRSVVGDNPAIVAGVPRFYMKRRVQKIDILENVVPLNRAQLRELDLPTEEVRTKVVARDGLLKTVVERRLGDGVTITTREVNGEMSDIDVRSALVEAVMQRPGETQRELLAIKKELEVLQNLSGKTLRQFTQGDYEMLVLQAVRNAEEPSVYAVDGALRQIVQERNVSIEQYCAQGLREQIRRDAIPYVSVGERDLHVTYEQGRPVVRNVPFKLAEAIPDSVKTPDGREILFRVPVRYRKSDGGIKPKKRTRATVDLPGFKARERMYAQLPVA